MSLFAELKRRNVIRAAVFYAAGAWLVAQVAGLLLPVFHAEDWVLRWVVIALAIGFPFWLAFAWFYEFTPEGIKRESEIAPADSITAHTGKKLDRWIFAVMGLAIVLLLTNTFVWRKGAGLAETAAPATAAIPSIEADPSIAVLPFVNLSSDKDQEYFSDGISDELMNLLAKVPKLRVIARTSSFSFRGKEATIDEIARKLNVAALLEGSVRKSGNAVRITVQLIRASDSTHLWSEDYDRTLEDIFKVQDEIAATVVEKLKVTLLGAAPTVRPVDPKAYALLLQANALARQSSAASRQQALALFQQVTEMAPDDARAWSGLGRVYLNQWVNSEGPPQEGERLAKEAFAKALALDPSDGLTYSRLAGAVQIMDNDSAAAAPLLQKALALDPGNLGIVGNASIFLAGLARLDEAIALDEYGTSRDPANPTSFGNLSNDTYYAKRWDDAIAAARTAISLSPEYSQAHYNIGIALLLGRNDAAGALKEFQAERDEVVGLAGLPLALDALGRKPEADAALAELSTRYERGAQVWIAGIYVRRGDTDRAFAWLDKAVANGDPNLQAIHVDPIFDPVHQDARWLPLLRRLGVAPEQLAKIELKVTLPSAVPGS